MKYAQNIIFFILILFLSTFTIVPLFHEGFFTFHDNTQIVRVFEMAKSLSQGMFPVRWVGDLGYGYGYPLFNFYGPLPYYIGGIFELVGFSTLFATKSMFFIGILISGISMYLFSKRFFGVKAGLVSAIFYVYFPYHAVNIYVRGAVGEFYAYAFLPFLFLGIFNISSDLHKKLFSRENLINIFFIAIGFFLIAISHNLTLFMTCLFIVPLVILLMFTHKSKKNFLALTITGLILGIFMSGFYIFPAFFEMGYTNVSSQVGGGANFPDHYVCLNQFWNSMWGYGGSVAGCIDGLSFRLGKINILMVLTSIALLVFTIVKRKAGDNEKKSVIALVMLLIAMFLTLQYSEFIWRMIPYMQFIQYPWRFINFIGLFSAFLVGYLIFRIDKFLPKIVVWGIVASLIIGMIVVNYKLFVPQNYISFSQRSLTDPSYIKFTVSKISDEYMPSLFEKPQDAKDIPDSPAKLSYNTGNITVVAQKADYLKLAYDSKDYGILHINRAYFPSWEALIDTKIVPIYQSNKGMDIQLSPGSGIIELKFTSTPIQKIGNIVTIIGFLMLLILLFTQKIGKFKGIHLRKNV